MALELKQELKLQQKLVITQQLQQVIKLLQYNNFELRQEINKELSENPVLEEEEFRESVSSREAFPENTLLEGYVNKYADAEATNPAQKYEEAKESFYSHSSQLESEQSSPEKKEDNGIDWERYLENNNQLSPIPAGSNYSALEDEGLSYDQKLTETETLQDHLIWQLRLDNLDEKAVSIGAYLIGNLDDKGYLADEAVFESIENTLGATREEIEIVRKIISGYDPIGCCCRNVKECLLAQAKALYSGDDKLEKLINDHLEDIEFRRIGAISKALKLSSDGVKELIERLRTLEPYPGGSFLSKTSREGMEHITPDLYVEKVGDEYFVRLNNDGLPRLRASRYYERLLKGSADKKVKDVIRDNLNRAKLLINGIEQRQRTITKVMQEILKRQKAFFDRGFRYLEPMILKDIADQLGMHPSTISRATSSKYVHTPQGIFELKFFFSRAVPQSEPHLPPISAEALHYMLNEIIKKESDGKPFSDAELVEKLKEKYQVSILRRTLSKHRAEMGLLSATRRTAL